MRLRGIDVSHYQGDIDWFAVAGSDVKFAFVKGTESSTAVDSKFTKNYGAVRDVGLYRGAYHFGRPGGDPETQAAHFASVVGELGFCDLPPVLDLEEADGHSAQHVLAWAEAFVDKAEALFRRKLIVYTGGFWRFQLGNPNSAFFAARKLWLAAYTPHPVVPKSWQNWTFWQYSDGSHNGPSAVPGVRRPVDQNWFDDAEGDLASLCGAERPLAPEITLPATGEGKPWPGVHLVWPHKPALSGEAVRLFQTRLAALGFQVEVDGVYGPQSKTACIAFQRDRGLKGDGIVGPKTWDACVNG